MRVQDHLGSLETFLEVVKAGSFTRVAGRLGVTPSAVSRRVMQLERELGVRLFHRTTRAMRLTDEGRVFHEGARHALEELQRARDGVQRLREQPMGLLRVEAPSILGRHLLAPALPAFLARFPEVQVELTLTDRPSDLASGGVDVAIRVGPLVDSALVGRRLGWTRMRVCGAPGYLRRRGTPRSIAALARHERIGLAMNGRPLPWRLEEDGAIREIAPGRRLVTDDAEAVLDLALAGAGLAWVCDFMVSRARRAGELMEVLERSGTERSPVHALSLPSRHVLPKVRAFVEATAHALEESGALARR